MADRNDESLRIGVFISIKNIGVYSRDNLLAAFHNNQNWFIFALLAF